MLLGAACSAWLALGAPTDAPPSPEKPLEALPLDQRDETRARAAFQKGAAAYGEGRFADAIPHFLDSYRYSGRPGPLFSLGQAHRRRYEQDSDPRQRQLALMRYEQYEEAAPDGTRLAEARRYIKELLEQSPLEGIGEVVEHTRVSVSSPAPGATAAVDGGPAFVLPKGVDVEPGKHRVVVSAPGFRASSRTVDVLEGSTVTVEMPLDVVKAEIQVDAPEGSDLWVDGQRVARLPARRAIKVDPGVRQIGVARPGRALFVDEVELEPGETRKVKADLERTGQRKIAFAAIGVGSAGLLGSAVLTGLAFRAQAQANARDEAIEGEGFATSQQSDAHINAVERRDAYRTAAIAVGVSSAVFLGTGLILFFTEKPPVASQLRGGPSVGTNHVGATLEGRF